MLRIKGMFAKLYRCLQTQKGRYVLVFLLSALLLYAAYAIFGVYPYGEKSILVLDLGAQYVPYYEHFRDVFYGNASAFISWSRNLSGEMMGLFAYYLASPFSLILLLFPRTMIVHTVMLMQLMKVGTASVTFCWYLNKSKHCKDNRVIAFSLMYSLMTYTIVQLMNPMWLDGVIYLPLICYGIEQLADTGRCTQFIISLALMFMADFYIGWMIAIFSCLYFLCYYSFLTNNKKIRSIKQFVKSGIKFGVSGIIAAMCSAWLLIPLYYSLSLGKFNFTEPTYEWRTQFEFIDFFVNLLPNTYDTCYPEGAPLIYCGVLPIILTSIYFFNCEIPLKRKVGYIILLMSLVLSMYVSNIDIFWHGMQEPQWLPYRYSFLFSFVMLLIAFESFKQIKSVSYSKIGVTLLAVCVYVLNIDKQHITVEYDIYMVEKTNIIYTTWFTVIFAALYALVLYVYKRRLKYKNVLLTVTCLLLCIELLTTNVYTLKSIDTDVVYANYKEYYEYTTSGRETVAKIKEIDDGSVYRIEKNYSNSCNDAMAMGYYGIAHSSSTLNESIIEFLRSLGFAYGGHVIEYRGETYVTDALFGIKYLMEANFADDVQASADTAQSNADVFTVKTFDMFEDFSRQFNDKVDIQTKTADYVMPKALNDVKGIERPVSLHYNDTLVYTKESDTQIISVFENPNALPIAYMADNAVASLKLDTWYKPFENQNRLLSALLSVEDVDYFKPVKIKYTIPTNVTTLENDTHTLYMGINKDNEASVEYLFDAPTTDMLYMFFPTDYEVTCDIYLNNEYLTEYYLGDTMSILALGHYDVGESVSLKFVLREETNEMYIKDTQIYYLDESLFKTAVEKLKQQSMTITEFKEDHIKGTVTAENDGILFTTVTYEPGWSVYVDGVKVKQIPIANALIGIPMTMGEHIVEMRFFPKGLFAGICVSVLGLCILCVIWRFEHKWRMQSKAY